MFIIHEGKILESLGATQTHSLMPQLHLIFYDKLSLLGLSKTDLEAFIKEEGEIPYRVEQIFNWENEFILFLSFY